MKRILSLALAGALCAIFLVGCKSDEKPAAEARQAPATPASTTPAVPTVYQTTAPVPAGSVRVTDVKQQRKYARVYLKVDPGKANLPWSFYKEKVQLITRSGERIPLRAMSYLVPLAVVLPGVSVMAGDAPGRLKYEILAGSDATIEVVAPVERPPQMGEMVFFFELASNRAKRLEIELEGGSRISVPVPPGR